LNDPANRFRYIATPTLEDPSLAPPGHHILTVSSACTEPVEGDEEMYTEEWSRRREDYEAEALHWLAGIIPGIAECVVTKDTATRRTVHRYTANSRGAVYGWDSGPGQFGRDRLGIETPFENLFLCGHWVEPGPGVASVAMSGALAARRAMETLQGARAPAMADQQ
jgi:prolycopene isomerase